MDRDSNSNIMSVGWHRKNRKACLTVIVAGVALPIIIFVVGTIVSSCGG